MSIFVIVPEETRSEGQPQSYELHHGISCVVQVGSVIGWGSMECATRLDLSIDVAPDANATKGSTAQEAIGFSTQKVSADSSTTSLDPHRPAFVADLQARRPTQAPSMTPIAAIPTLQLRSPADGANESHVNLKAPSNIPISTVTPRTPTLEASLARIKQEPAPTSFSHTSSPRTSINHHNNFDAPSANLNPEAIYRQRSDPSPILSTPSPTVTMTGPSPEQMLQTPATVAIQTKHAHELEALLMKHQLEVASLITNQRLELDALMRGAPLIPSSNGVNMGLLGIYSVLNRLQASMAGGRHALTNSDDIDIMSVDEQSVDREPHSWKTTAGGHGSAPVKAKRVTKKKEPANTVSHPNSSSTTPLPVNPFHSNSTAHGGGAKTPGNGESGSEDDGSRRTQRKRSRAAHTGYFVDDREMETILGGTSNNNSATGPSAKKRVETFATPTAPIATTPPASSIPVPYKKPKPRDNVSIATILDIYAPQKSAVKNWKSVYGTKTLILYHLDCLDHITPEWHLESPNRLRAVMESIGLVSERFPEYFRILTSFSAASLEAIRTCHAERYIRKIQGKIPANRAMPPLHATQDIELSLSMSSAIPRPSIEPACDPSDGSKPGDSGTPKDTFVSFGSWNAALLAAGSVIHAVDVLYESSTVEAGTTYHSEVRNVFCGVRPPGHHAGAHGHDGASTNGYCVLNSVAIGAFYAIDKYHLKKIAILDFDVHQGNGTAQIVEQNPNILFISLHASDIYPFSESTKAEADKCSERIINIGYPTGTTGKQFIELFTSRCKQLLMDYQPELILLSSGFDAHIDDPTGAAMLRFADYVQLTRIVKEIADTPTCQGRIISVLEGGYDIRALKLSVTAHLLTLTEGDAAPLPAGHQLKAVSSDETAPTMALTDNGTPSDSSPATNGGDQQSANLVFPPSAFASATSDHSSTTSTSISSSTDNTTNTPAAPASVSNASSQMDVDPVVAPVVTQ